MAAPTPAPAAVTPKGSDLPRPLFMVAMFLIVGGGIFAVFGLMRVKIPTVLLGAAEIGMGVGLLKLKSGWRIAALSWCGIVMGLCALSIIFLLLTKGKHPLLFGHLTKPGLNFMWTLLSFVVFGSCYYVLTRPPVKAVFK